MDDHQKTKEQLVTELQNMRQQVEELEKIGAKYSKVTAALQASEERYRTLYRKTPAMLHSIDPDGRLLSVNDYWLEVLGYEREEVLGKPSIDFLSDASRRYAEQVALPGYFATGVARDVPYQWRKRNGELIEVLLSATSESDTEGNFVRSIAVMVDVTKRRQAEQELRYQATLLDNVSEAVIATDLDFNIQMWNHAATGMYGWQASEVVGLNMAQVVPIRYLDGADEADVIAQFQLDGVWEDEVIQQHRDGHDIHVHASVAVVRDEQGQPIGAVAVNRDITEQKKAQERESDLHRQAEEHEKLAAVGQLAAGIAHDFNNLLTGVMGHAQMMLLTRGVPEAVRTDAQVILEQGQRAAKLIRQILDFSRKSIMQRQALSLLPFVEEQIKLLQRTIPENIGIELVADQDQYIVNASPTQMQQILTNLAVNARDAMGEGGQIQIGLARRYFPYSDSTPFPEMAVGDWIVLSISDTGTGIPQEIRKRIYEPFFTTKETGQGTGLGLSQVYGIVKQHGGFIDVESTIAVGSKFLIYLPVQGAHTELSSDTVVSHFQLGQQQSSLIVEDEQLVRNVLQRMLESLGYTIYTARNGEEALDTYESNADIIALVLTDVVMPKMGGIELIDILQARSPSLRFVLMSGYPLRQEDCHGAAGWLQKPPKLAELAETIWEALNG